MANIVRSELDVIVFQEVNKFWAEEAHRALSSSPGQRWNLCYLGKKAIMAKEIGSVGWGSAGLGRAGLSLS